MFKPIDLGFPESFTEFRDCQHEAFEFALTTEKRFVALGIPPGGGKSAVAFGLAKLFGGRTTILTATHGLEDQYVETLNSDGRIRISHIRGRRNYPCWEGGNCDDGRRMECADKLGCPYLADLRVFNEGSVGITNYAYWLAVNARGEGVVKPDTLICDEVGLADSWLSNSLDFRLTERQGREARLGFGRPGEDIEEWAVLAPGILERAFTYLTAVQQESKAAGRYAGKDFGRLRRAEEIYDAAYKLSQVSKSENNWICTRVDGSDEGRMWKFQCVWPGRYKERLFQGVKRIILMSATLRPYTLRLLGIKRDDCDFKEWGRQFPAANGPVIWIPTVKVKHDEKMSNEDRQAWLNRHDEIFTWGKDRNGLSHTVSYQRAKALSEALGERHKLILNGAADPESSTATDAFDRFRSSGVGCTLVSPSFSTGWDFAGKIAEWQVLSKMPILPPTDKLVKARSDQDRDYPWYKAGQDLVQACGRINRFAEDRGTTLIVDDQIKWLVRAAGEHIPRWFKFRKEEQLPRPLDKL